MENLECRYLKRGYHVGESRMMLLRTHMTKPVWSHVLALSARTMKKAHIVSCQVI